MRSFPGRWFVAAAVLALLLVAVPAASAGSPSWADAGAMAAARSTPTATLLDDGRVLVVGGAYARGELFDPANNTFAPTPDTRVIGNDLPVWPATATRLLDGRVLLVGAGSPVSGAALYDPATGMFSIVDDGGEVRSGFTATRLLDGRVLVAGGNGASAELFDPGMGKFIPTGNLKVARDSPAAVLLPDGHVLVVGGTGQGATCLDSAELYNPANGSFSLTGSLNLPACEAVTATLLDDGRVLVTAGHSGVFASADLYDPSTGAFTPTGSASQARDQPTVTALPGGHVLFAGGQNPSTLNATTAATVYDRTSGGFVTTPSMHFARYGAAGVLLPDCRVLVAGGSTAGPPPGPSAQSSAELYSPFLDDANIRIAASGTSGVGTTRMVTAHVNVCDGSGSHPAPNNTQISFSISGPGPSITSDTCTVIDGTGSCRVALTSALAGVTTVSAQATVTVDGSLTRATDSSRANSDPAMVTWIVVPPGAPTGVTATAGIGQATVSFTPPVPSGGPPITKYTVTASDGTAVTTMASPVTVTGLTNGVPYTFTVTATDSVGTVGPASAPSNSVTPSAPPTAPGAPTSVSATAGNGQTTVSFSAPASNGGSAITSYTVTSSPGGLSVTGGASPLTVTGLTNGVGYTFTVTATNGVGTGPASAPSSAVTPTAPAAAAGGGSTATPTAPASGGGGGGGGGGAGNGPTFKVSIEGPSGPFAVGSPVTLVVRISNPGGNADSSNLTLSLSGLTYVSAQVDRGSGCAAGGGVSCFLDFFNSGLSATEVINVTVSSLPATLSASVASSPTGTSDTATWTGTGPASTTAFTPPAAAAPRVSASAKTFKLTVSVHGKGSVTRTPSKVTYPSGTHVTLTARPANGWRFGHWAGSCTGSKPSCHVTTNGAKLATAVFVARRKAGKHA
jgi:Divergent InlB B-repeat domain/Fibronectin type III domain